MVTPEQIDNELIEAILIDWPETLAYAMNRELRKNIVRRLLAYLANHPVEPTEELQKQIVMHWNKADCPQGWSKFAYEEFQRIAYLKKEPKLPEELKQLQVSIGYGGLDRESVKELNERFIAAFKLGQQSKGE